MKSQEAPRILPSARVGDPPPRLEDGDAVLLFTGPWEGAMAST